MIILREQYGYKKAEPIEGLEHYIIALNKKDYTRTIQRGDNKCYCFNITYQENEINSYRFETSYFVGVDWIIENKLPIYVKPKLNDDNSEVNYVQMLFDILKEPTNYNHLDQLCEIDFDKPTIAIEQKQDLLTPLLLVQYISILKKIAQKGLKKSYYTITKNLNSRVKGKILINETVKKNQFNSKILFNYCKYSEFGINSIENKVLKKALTFSIAAIQNLKGIDTSKMNDIINYIKPAFENVDSDINIEELKAIRNNKFYKEYTLALKFAKIILKRYGYNISSTSSNKINTPPFWIDMSKLFELYVFAKLKERFSRHREVTYHKKFNYLEPDYIINSCDGNYKIVVDAKYKPKYKDGKVSTEDIRQISGYARLKEVYKFLDLEKDKILDCLIIYSNQNANRKDFIEENFVLDAEEDYIRIFKIGIELPNHVTKE